MYEAINHYSGGLAVRDRVVVQVVVLASFLGSRAWEAPGNKASRGTMLTECMTDCHINLRQNV